MTENKLNDVINSRLKLKSGNVPENEMDYIGFDMSGYGFGDDERSNLGMHKCRVENWLLLINNFRDYLPSMTIDNFKLFCWKGSVWWGDDDHYSYDKINEEVPEFNGFPTADIIEWIIRNYGINKEKFKE